MDKIWTSAKVKIRNRLDFIRYGQRIGYINIVAIVIDLAILLYSAIDYQTLMRTGNLFLFLFLVPINTKTDMFEFKHGCMPPGSFFD